MSQKRKGSSRDASGKYETYFCFLCSIGLVGASCAVQAESVYQLASGPETTLDSIWAASGYMHTLTHTVAFQMDMTRLTAEKGSRLWGGGLASFGDASVRNDHPSFDYSAGGYAIGYDYSRYEGETGFLAGLAVGQMFGHQNVKEMPDHPDGMIPGDRYRQIFLGADFYGAVLRDITPRSHLIFRWMPGPVIWGTNAVIVRNGTICPNGIRTRFRFLFPPPGVTMSRSHSA